MAQSDADLILRTLDSDQEAFAELYDRYAALVRAVCFDGTGDYGVTQDLAQEVFIRAYDRLGKLRDRDRFGAWLVGIAKFVCREYRRGRFRDRHVLVGLDPHEIQPVEVDREDDRVAALQDAMARLGEKERLALRAFYLQEQDVEQARKVLKVSRASFYRLLDRAKKRLAELMSERESKDEGSNE